MIRTLAWKEYREQRMIWAALGALTFLLVWGFSQLIAPGNMSPRKGDIWPIGVLAALALAGTYGLVCGALLIGGERESGAQVFLDRLSTWRIKVWAAKLLAGMGLAVSEALLITVAVGVLGYGSVLGSGVEWFGALAGVAVEALAWGMLGAAIFRNVLAASGLSALLLAVSWIVCGPITWPLEVNVIVRRIMLALAALCASGLFYCRPDLQRLPMTEGRLSKLAKAGQLPSVWALLWMCWRQGRVTICLLAVPALAAGLLLPTAGLVIWPTATLLVGIICGIGVFAGDQSRESYRFLAERRLPTGRIWAVKIVFWLAVGAGMAGLIWIGTWAHITVNDIFTTKQVASYREMTLLERALPNSKVLRVVGPPVFITLWLVYGFCIGQFIGLVVRKPVIALFFAVVLSPLAVGLWVPSLVRGGLDAWQLFIVPVLLLLAGRALMRLWLNGRLYSIRGIARIGGCVLAAAGWMGGCLWYRVTEVPDVGEPFDVKAFIAGLPSPKENKAGHLFAEVAREYREHEKLVLEKLAPPKPAREKEGTENVSGLPSANTSYIYLTFEVIEKGWEDRDGQLGRWLDQMFEGKWVRDLREASALPLGVFADPRNLTFVTWFHGINECHEMANALDARALQLQARGDPGVALDSFRLVLWLSRGLRNRSVSSWYRMGCYIECEMLRTLDHWVNKLGPNPLLIRRALDELTQHEKQIPPIADSLKAEYLMVLNSFNQLFFNGSLGYRRSADWNTRLDHGLNILTWQVPWETQRASRIINALFAQELEMIEMSPRDFFASYDERGEAKFLTQTSPWNKVHRDSIFRYIAGDYRTWTDRAETSRLRATRLKLALALYQIHEHKPASKLADLVPRYLPKLPIDPFTGESFHYRISRGERLTRKIRKDDKAFQDVPPGQGILWTVVPSWWRDFGRNEWMERDGERYRMVFLVPRWGKE